MTFNEEDLNSLSSKKKVVKHLYGDDAFKLIFDKVAYDVGGVSFNHERYMYDACVICVDTLIGVLDRESNDTEQVDIELEGYFVASVSVENGEKVFAITPDGAMKKIIKSDVALG
jgi:predicted proteasome-type protease